MAGLVREYKKTLAMALELSKSWYILKLRLVFWCPGVLERRRHVL